MILKVGDPCWIEHHHGTLVAKQDDKFHVRLDGGGMIKISAIAIPDDDFTPAPFYRDADQVIWQFVRRYCWFLDDCLVLRYDFRTPYNRSRHGESHTRTRSDLATLIPIDNPYLSDEDVEAALGDTDEEAAPIRVKINSLESELALILSKNQAVRDRCNHEWEVGAEQEGKRSMIGLSCSRTDTCTKCEQTNYQSYTRL